MGGDGTAIWHQATGAEPARPPDVEPPQLLLMCAVLPPPPPPMTLPPCARSPQLAMLPRRDDATEPAWLPPASATAGPMVTPCAGPTSTPGASSSTAFCEQVKIKVSGLVGCSGAFLAVVRTLGRGDCGGGWLQRFFFGGDWGSCMTG